MASGEVVLQAMMMVRGDEVAPVRLAELQAAVVGGGGNGIGTACVGVGGGARRRRRCEAAPRTRADPPRPSPDIAVPVLHLAGTTPPAGTPRRRRTPPRPPPRRSSPAAPEPAAPEPLLLDVSTRPSPLSLVRDRTSPAVAAHAGPRREPRSLPSPSHDPAALPPRPAARRPLLPRRTSSTEPLLAAIARRCLAVAPDPSPPTTLPASPLPYRVRPRRPSAPRCARPTRPAAPVAVAGNGRPTSPAVATASPPSVLSLMPVRASAPLLQPR